MKAISLIKRALSYDDYCEFLSGADSFKRVHVQSVPEKKYNRDMQTLPVQI